MGKMTRLLRSAIAFPPSASFAYAPYMSAESRNVMPRLIADTSSPFLPSASYSLAPSVPLLTASESKNRGGSPRCSVAAAG